MASRKKLGGDEADRQRVMPHSFFILYRLFLRVDNVLFRIYDVRTYHKFGSGEVIRESSGMEADYDTIKSVSLSSSSSSRG
jgi:type 2A phosphatase activator TIP41